MTADALPPAEDGPGIAYRYAERMSADASLGEPRDVAERFGAGGWRFDSEVAGVFDDHVRASVPFYDAIQELIAEACDWLTPRGALVADLGCSTGNTALAILERHKDRELRFELYDESVPMLARARPAVEALAPGRVGSHPGALQDGLGHDDADLTLAVFVLQFMPWRDRAAVLAEAWARAAHGGALIVAEKIRPHDARWAEIGQNVSHDYKAAAGIADEAIRAKERALRGVLRPCSLVELVELVERSGWGAAEVLFRWHQWAVLGAYA
jgi:tRNA (cmo5U34)-methyltransferase